MKCSLTFLILFLVSGCIVIWLLRSDKKPFPKTGRFFILLCSTSLLGLVVSLIGWIWGWVP